MSPDVYAQQMAAGGSWGGQIELALLARAIGRDIAVYKEDDAAAGGYAVEHSFPASGTSGVRRTSPPDISGPRAHESRRCRTRRWALHRGQGRDAGMHTLHDWRGASRAGEMPHSHCRASRLALPGGRRHLVERCMPLADRIPAVTGDWAGGQGTDPGALHRKPLRRVAPARICLLLLLCRARFLSLRFYGTFLQGGCALRVTPQMLHIHDFLRTDETSWRNDSIGRRGLFRAWCFTRVVVSSGAGAAQLSTSGC